MAKEIPYFKFYTAEWSNGDITLEDYECQGLFINVCAYYWSKDCELSLNVLLKRFRGFESQINNLIESGIIKNEGEQISISFLNEQMQSKEVQKITNQKNGSKGGRPKKGKTEKKPSGFILETQTKANDNPNITNIEDSKGNNINTNSIDVRKLKFSQSLIPFIDLYGAEGIREFCDYWTEPNKSNTKFKQETEKTWDTTLRLKRWFKNDFNKPKAKLNKAIDQSQNKELFS